MRGRSMRALPRPPAAPRGVSRSRAQLSAEMTRIEFERERLARDAEMLEARLRAALHGLDRADRKILRLQDALSLSDEQ